MFKYRSTNVREYWIVDPQKLRVTVYHFKQDTEQDTMEEYSFEDEIPVGIYPGFFIQIEHG